MCSKDADGMSIVNFKVHKWASMQENLFLVFVNNKDTYKPVHLCSDQHLCYSMLGRILGKYHI